MSNFYLGNNQAGNFVPEINIDRREYLVGYGLQKLNGKLYLKRDGSNHLINDKSGYKGNPDLPERIGLNPVDETAEIVEADFSEYQGEENESIYQLEMVGDKVVVLLYTYSVRRLENDRIRIHLSMNGEEDFIKDGFNKTEISNLDELMKSLTDSFISNRSIFLQDSNGKKNQSLRNRSFRLIGDRCIGRLRMERPGVYILDDIKFKGSNFDLFGISQVFGDIAFITSSESNDEPGNKIESDLVPKTNEIFEAWEQFVSFEEEVYKDELPDCIYRYYNLKSNEEFLEFYVHSNIINEKLFEDDFEFISDNSLGADKTAPTDAQAIIDLKNTRERPNILVKKPVEIISSKNPNQEDEYTKLTFRKPLVDLDDRIFNSSGVIFLSDSSYRNDRRRKNRTLSEIKTKNNKTANMILRLTNPEVVDSQFGETNAPTSDKTLKKMFGTSKIELNENYRSAMSIALNTPDIALIQGPPGTGKTTLIQGIMSRIYELRKNCHILLSSEQHEALNNVLNKASNNENLPAFKIGNRYDDFENDEDQNDFMKVLDSFQEKCSSECENAMATLGESKSETKDKMVILSILQEFKDNGFSKNVVDSKIGELKTTLIRIDKLSETLNDLLVLENVEDIGSKDDTELSPLEYRLIASIRSQRTDLDTYLHDDGMIQLRSLNRLLRSRNYIDMEPYEDLLDIMLSGEENIIEYRFSEYLDFVDVLKNRFTPVSGNSTQISVEKYETAADNIISKVLKEKPLQDYDLMDIIEKFRFQMNDINVVSNIVKKYSSVIGSTCAQSTKSTDYSNLACGHYDYVIIDEAARANPVDIMIPIMLGTKVILVGDHFQLPHYIESKVMEKFEQCPEKFTEFKKELLKKSLFHLIYENLDRAYKEGKLKCRRTAMLEEQHRMNPVIGSFISKEFYGGKLRNAPETSNNVNEYGLFDGKNMAYVDVPRTKGMEFRTSTGGISRFCEVKCILDLLDMITPDSNGELPTIGIMSFYKKQVELIKEGLEAKALPDEMTERISVNTVDSFQGKEFDIVILSGTRSNTEHSIGFIQTSSSRVNVAMSRAKKLLVFVGDCETFTSNVHFENFFNNIDGKTAKGGN